MMTLSGLELVDRYDLAGEIDRGLDTLFHDDEWRNLSRVAVRSVMMTLAVACVHRVRDGMADDRAAVEEE